MPWAPKRHRSLPRVQRVSAARRGYDRRWQKASRAFLLSHPQCHYCPAPATCVDHAIPHQGDQALFWDQSNWRPSCGPCNSRKAATQEGGFGR